MHLLLEARIFQYTALSFISQLLSADPSFINIIFQPSESSPNGLLPPLRLSAACLTDSSSIASNFIGCHPLRHQHVKLQRIPQLFQDVLILDDLVFLCLMGVSHFAQLLFNILFIKYCVFFISAKVLQRFEYSF